MPQSSDQSITPEPPEAAPQQPSATASSGKGDTLASNQSGQPSGQEVQNQVQLQQAQGQARRGRRGPGVNSVGSQAKPGVIKRVMRRVMVPLIITTQISGAPSGSGGEEKKKSQQAQGQQDTPEENGQNKGFQPGGGKSPETPETYNEQDKKSPEEEGGGKLEASRDQSAGGGQGGQQPSAADWQKDTTARQRAQQKDKQKQAVSKTLKAGGGEAEGVVGSLQKTKNLRLALKGFFGGTTSIGDIFISVWILLATVNVELFADLASGFKLLSWKERGIWFALDAVVVLLIIFVLTFIIILLSPCLEVSIVSELVGLKKLGKALSDFCLK